MPRTLRDDGNDSGAERERSGPVLAHDFQGRGAVEDMDQLAADEMALPMVFPRGQRQLEKTGKPVALRASSMLMHLEAIRAGTGRGVLPCYVGDGHPLLERLTPRSAEIAAEYWIIVRS